MSNLEDAENLAEQHQKATQLAVEEFKRQTELQLLNQMQMCMIVVFTAPPDMLSAEGKKLIRDRALKIVAKLED